MTLNSNYLSRELCYQRHPYVSDRKCGVCCLCHAVSHIEMNSFRIRKQTIKSKVTHIYTCWWLSSTGVAFLKTHTRTREFDNCCVCRACGTFVVNLLKFATARRLIDWHWKILCTKITSNEFLRRPNVNSIMHQFTNRRFINRKILSKSCSLALRSWIIFKIKTKIIVSFSH